jgi:hypothetical protein
MIFEIPWVLVAKESPVKYAALVKAKRTNGMNGKAMDYLRSPPHT